MKDRITDKAKWKVKMETFFQRYGLKAKEEESFGVKKSSIYKWRKLLRDNQGTVEVLVYGSKSPGRKSKPKWDHRILDFFRCIRYEYPRMGKTKIKLFLDEFCRKENIRSFLESSISRINKAHKFFNEPMRISHFGKIKAVIFRKKLRRQGYKSKHPGELFQPDSIVGFSDGINKYFITAMDFTSGFGIAHGYRSLSSKSGLDFFEKLQSKVPFKIKSSQTDYGCEFEKHFREHLEKREIKTFWNYPKHQQLNAKFES